MTWYRRTIASWPSGAREAWGQLANSLTPPGLIDWQDHERSAFEMVLARVRAGEFDEVKAKVIPTTRKATQGRFSSGEGG